MNKEYTYDIEKYTIGVDANGEDGIGLTVAIINDDGEIHFLGNCYGDNARCIDLLIKENQRLKELINYLKKQQNVLKSYVCAYEKRLRNTSKDSFYYNSYLKAIHKYNAQRELIKEILSKIEKR